MAEHVAVVGPKGSEPAVEAAVLDGLGEVVRLDARSALQVGEGAGDPQDLVVRAGRQAQLGHRLLEQHLAGGVQLAELPHLPRGHRGVGRDAVAEAGALPPRAKHHVITDANSLPLAVISTGAIRGKAIGVRKTLFSSSRACQRAWRIERWKLIRYPLINRTQLFDLEADPYEINDLANRPEQAERIKELTAALRQWQKTLGDIQPLTSPEPAPADWAPPKKEG